MVEKNKGKMKAAFSQKGALVIALMAVIQIGYLLIFNILRMETEINMDSSEYLVQVMQIFRQGTLLIDDYYYSTALMWDMPTLLAVIFYAVTKDVFLAWGLSVDVFVIILAIVVYRLCGKLEITPIGRWLSILAIFTVYDFGLVDYADVMFVNGATYLVRIIVMLLLVDVVIGCHKDDKLPRGRVALYFVVLVGLFISGMSTGMFALGCCVLPIFLFEVCFILKSEKLFRIKDCLQLPFLMTVGAIAATLAGMAANRLLGLPQSQEMSKALLSAECMPKQLGQNIVGILKLFGWPDEGTMLFSGAGIAALLSLVVFTAWWCVFLAGTFFMLRRKNANSKTEEARKAFAGVALCVFLVNFALFSVVDLKYGGDTVEYRYWVIPVVMVFLEIGLFWQFLKEKVNVNYRLLAVIGFSAVLLFLNLRNDVRLWQSGYWTYPFLEAHAKVRGVVADTDVDTLFVYTNFYRGRILCTYATEGVDMFAVTMEAEDGRGNWTYGKLSMPRWGTYVKYDGDCLEMPESCHIGILLDTSIEYDADFLMARATKRTPVGDSELVLLEMEENYMDFVQGIPIGTNEIGRDYFNQGYGLEHVKVNENGLYQSEDNGEAILLNETFLAETSGVYDVTLRYEVMESVNVEAGILTITVLRAENQDDTYEVEIGRGGTDASLHGIRINQGDKYSVCIRQADGTVLALDYIEFSKADRG